MQKVPVEVKQSVKVGDLIEPLASKSDTCYNSIDQIIIKMKYS